MKNNVLSLLRNVKFSSVSEEKLVNYIIVNGAAVIWKYNIKTQNREIQSNDFK